MPNAQRLFPLLLAPAFALLVPSAVAQGPEAAFPLVERFEEGERGIPAGWVDASDGELSVHFSQERKQVREGKGALRVDVPAWDAGAMEIRRGGLPVKTGSVYFVEAWLRAEAVRAPVLLSVRRTGRNAAPHAARWFSVGPEWRRCVLEVRPEQDDPAAVLSLALAGSGTLWIDALRVTEGELPVEPEPALGPAVKGNRVQNSSFELGKDGWTMGESIAVVEAETPEGRRFARWLPGPFPLQCRPFTALPGRKYTVSLLLRSQRPEARAEVSVIEAGNEFRARETFALTPEWKRHSFSFTAPCGRSDRYFLSLAPEDRSHGIDVDAVQVEEGDLTDYRPAGVLELASGLTRARLFPQPDQAIGVPVQVYAREGIPAGAAVQLRLEGFYGENISRYRAELKAGPTHAEQPIQIRIPMRGTVRLRLEGLVGDQVVSTAETILTALPELDPKPNPDSFFGGHGSVGRPGEWHAPSVAARAGMRWWRLHDLGAYTEWAVAEPERGKFQWYDREIDGLRSRGLSLLGVLARTPDWAGQDPGGERSERMAWPPARITDFGNYVRQVAGHYRGRVDAYEIWNEPWSRRWWAGSPEKYAEIAKAAGGVLREADPQAQVVGGGFWVPQPEFTDRALAKGLASAVGPMSYHQYFDPAAVTFNDGGRDRLTQWYEALRRKLDLAGAEKAELWNTEGGIGCPSYYSWLGAEEQGRAAARALAKMLVLSRANGVRRFFYYHVWQEIGAPRMFDWLLENNWALLDYDGSGKPTLAAYAGCARSLEGAEPFDRVERRDLKAYLFRRGRHTLMVLWSPPALVAPLDVAVKLDVQKVRVLNLMGNPRAAESEKGMVRFPVRNEPLYVHVLGTEPEAVLAALKEAVRPLP